MKLEFKQSFRILHTTPLETAQAYLRDPLASLKGVGFMRDLKLEGSRLEENRLEAPIVTAELLVSVPLLGDLPIPFKSTLEPTAEGANLHPLELSGKTWAKVSGVGRALETELLYDLHVEVFVELPGGEKWGGFAFSKMVDATSKKALERVLKEFPRGVSSGLVHYSHSKSTVTLE